MEKNEKNSPPLKRQRQRALINAYSKTLRERKERERERPLESVLRELFDASMDVVEEKGRWMKRERQGKFRERESVKRKSRDGGREFWFCQIYVFILFSVGYRGEERCETERVENSLAFHWATDSFRSPTSRLCLLLGFHSTVAYIQRRKISYKSASHETIN